MEKSEKEDRIYGSWTSVSIWESDRDHLIQQQVLSQQENDVIQIK